VGHSFVELALRCYPRWWKERYDEEMRAVVDDLKLEGRSENTIAFGLLRDAMRSRLQSRGMPRTYGVLANRTRTSVAASTLPWMAIVPFVLTITGTYVLHPLSGDVIVGYPFQLSPFPTKVLAWSGGHYQYHPALSTATWVGGISVMVVQALFLVTLLILAVGLSALRYGIKREKARNRRWMYRLTWTPLITFLGILGLEVARAFVNGASTSLNGHVTWVGGNPAAAAMMGDLIWVISIGGWLLSMVGLAVVANRVNVPPDTLRFGRTVSVLTSISMSLTFIAFIVWGVAIDIQGHQSPAVGTVVATYPRHDLWQPMALALGLACAASIWGATTARRSWRTIRSQRLWEA
jgi:hypothetical protein